ncbi:MAG: DUF4397 domain-containing protein [Anaerolineae bacterium]|nr:DUF4397 domain-containing protein [Anaerolineae bacterium]
MLFIKRSIIGLVILILVVTGTSLLAQAEDGSQVRFVHTIPGASAIDVYVDNTLTARNLAFGEATPYIDIASGQRAIKVTPAGATTALWEQTLDAGSRTAYTLVASTQDDNLFFSVYPDDFTAVPLGKTRFTIIHAVPGAPAVDLLLEDGSPVIPGVQYAQPQTSGTLDIQVLPYSMVIVPSGEGVDSALASTSVLQLASGTSQMLLVYGTPNDPQLKMLAAPTNAQDSGGFVRIINGIPNGSPVDVYINETLAAIIGAPPESDNATGFIAVPTGTYDVAVRASGTEQDLATASLDVAEGDYLTVVALSSGEDVTLSAFSASLDASADMALVRVINGGSEETAVSAILDDGTTLADTLEANTAGDVVAIEPSTQSISLNVNSAGGSNIFTTEAQDFNGGAFYDLVVLDADALLLYPVALAQAPGSVPGATMAMEEPVAEATVEAMPTEAPQEVMQPTETPLEQPTAPPVTAGDQAIGRVFNLNPDANLQLRRYPDIQAESLGLLPFGATVTVNGREGELIPNQPATPIPPDYEYVDPVTELEEDEDLPREQTWLNITYNTPDGGTITAWVRSDFLDVRNPAGEQLLLRDLDTVPGNLAGEKSNTQFASPSQPQNVVSVRITNINPGANVNIRRTSSENGENLESIPLDATATLLGLNDAETWAYVSYSSPSGCEVDGWVSTEYVEYLLNDNSTDLAELNARGLPATIADTQLAPPPDCSGAAVQPTVQPTPIRNQIVATVILDPGANLNLRRDPTESSAVLVQVPSGGQLIVNGRTGDGDWLQVTYNSTQGAIDGWIAARKGTPEGTAVFVRLSFNGETYEIEQVPLSEGEVEEPTATPTLAG